AVSDAIVERGDDETLGVLLGNEGASLSRAASEAAVERARANPALHAVTVERFAEAPDAPHQLIRRLANDEAETVAAPVLSASPVLTEADLIGVVRSRGQGHMRAVSRRAAVSEAVSDAIVERGDDETLGVLLGNEGASLSRAASETAVERARANPAL